MPAKKPGAVRSPTATGDNLKQGNRKDQGIKMRIGAILSLMAAGLLAACGGTATGHADNAVGSSEPPGAETATLPDTSKTPRELELEPQALRYEQATIEANAAAQQLAAATRAVQEAAARADRAKEVLDSDRAMSAEPSSSTTLVSALTTLMTPSNGTVDCGSQARAPVLEQFSREASIAVPRHWTMGNRYSQEVDALMAAPGAYALLSRTNEAPQHVLGECEQAVNPDRFVRVATSMADAACAAVAGVTPLEQATVAETGEPLQSLNPVALHDSITSACADLKTVMPSHPLLQEAAAMPRLYRMAWESTLAGVMNGRKAVSEQAAALVPKAQASVQDAALTSERLRTEIASLETPYRQYQIEVKSREQRIARATQMRAQMEAAANYRRELALAKARNDRERAWQEAGNSGLSPDGVRECRNTHGATMFALVNASTATAMTQGDEAAADWVIEQARQRGIPDECIRLLSRS